MIPGNVVMCPGAAILNKPNTYIMQWQFMFMGMFTPTGSSPAWIMHIVFVKVLSMCTTGATGVAHLIIQSGRISVRQMEVSF